MSTRELYSADPSKKSTMPVSSEYSAVTTRRPSSRINCSRMADPRRNCFADARILARHGLSPPGRPDRSLRSQAARVPRRVECGRQSSEGWATGLRWDAQVRSSVARMAPQLECPRTTTSRVPKRSAANSTLPTWEGATIFPATRMTE